MKTTDLFKINRSSKRINESMEKMFGQKINFESFDLPRLEDARNKLRTQLSQIRAESGFNENLENEALSKAQFMLDAINSAIAERQEFIADPHVAEVSEEGEESGIESRVLELLRSFDENANEIGAYGNADAQKIVELLKQGDVEGAAGQVWYAYSDQDGGEVPEIEPYVDDLQDEFEVLVQGGKQEYGDWGKPVHSDESVAMEKAPPGAKAERMVKHIKAGYAKDGKLTDKEKSIAYATAWKQHNKEKNESIESGDNMTQLREGEIQQASAIVTAKTMVDRVGRWIEELSGMENDTLLQLGDSIRDEMSADQAKRFISQCAPAIQQALQNLKDTRETLSTGVRMLTGEEQGAEMLGGDGGIGGEPGMGAEPDAMNSADEGPIDFGPPEDEFGAADAAAGGLEAAGREQRESIEYSNKLLKVLAG